MCKYSKLGLNMVARTLSCCIAARVCSA